MKILILQLARLGDLYQTWPVARALRRAHPKAEIALLARSRFSSAVRSLEAVDRALLLPSREILSPLLADLPDLDVATSAMQSFLDELRSERFDLAVNLSYSPLSSYLAFAIEAGETRGYSRHADGHLAIPDDASAYFYAQAGPDRENRIHLTDVFAQAAGVDLEPQDWRPSREWKRGNLERCGRRVLIHVGASDSRKTLSPAKWAGVAREMLKRRDGDFEIALIGSTAESPLADAIVSSCGDERLVNLVGRTDAGELEREIAHAGVLVGGDSGPMQIASLARVPALCLSFPSVSHWETGPRSAGSRALLLKDENDVGSDAIAEEALRLFDGLPPSRACWVSQGPQGPWLPSEPVGIGGTAMESEQSEFGWRLLRAIYMGDAFPEAPDSTFALACLRLSEANALALAQLRKLQAASGDATASLILQRADELFATIARLEPRVGPLARWLDTERLRVGPARFAEIAAAYGAIHEKFSEILRIYSPSGPPSEEERAPGGHPWEGAVNGS